MAGEAADLEWLKKPIKDAAASFEIDLESTWKAILGAIAGGNAESLGVPPDSIANANQNGSLLEGAITFGTAALYLQSSAALYSKKVDFVHARAYQVLSAISGGAKGPGEQEKRQRRVRRQGETPLLEEEEEAPEAETQTEPTRKRGRAHRHFHLASFAQNGTEGSHCVPRMPMSLMPLEDFEKMNIPIQPKGRSEAIGKREDFAMNSGIMEVKTAAILLDRANEMLAEMEVGAALDPVEPPPIVALDADAPPSSQTLQPAMEAGGREASSATELGRAQSTRPSGSDILGFRGSVSALKHSQPPSRSSARLSEMARIAESGAAEYDGDDDDYGGDDGGGEEEDEEEELEPWSDRSQSSSRPLKPRKGRHHRIPAPQKRLQALKRKIGGGVVEEDKDSQSLLPSLTNFLYPSRREERKIPQDYAAFVPAALEELLYQELKRRRKAQAPSRRRAKERRETRPDGEGDDAYEAEEDEGDDYEGEEEVEVEVAEGWGPQSQQVPGGLRDDDFLSVPGTRSCGSGYEALVQSYCARYFEEGKLGLAVSELGRRVEAWEARVKPLLSEEEERRPFRIHSYGGELLGLFGDLGEQKEFVRLTAGLQRWEIPRYFLSSLIMANTKNFDLKEEELRSCSSARAGLEGRVGTLSLRLASTHSHLQDIQESDVL